MQPDSHTTDEQPPKEPPQPAPVISSNEASPRPASVVTLAPDSFSATPEASETPSVDVQPVASGEPEPVRWQAHEYIHHEKSPVWFVAFGLVMLGLMAIAVFLIQSLTFAILIPVMAAAILVYSHRPPRLLDYTLSRQGLHINDHLYSFNEFKGFRVIHDGQEYSVMLLPVKRFKPGVSVYFPEESGEAIVDMLGSRLPMQDFHLDLVDKIIRKLRI
jgi:hypothetical protein